MDAELIIKACSAAQQGARGAFATIVETTKKGTPQKPGAKMLVLSDGSLYGTIGGGRNELAAKEECLKAIEDGQTRYVVYDFFGGPGQSVCGGQMKVFIEPIQSRERLIICGAGHIALPLSIIAKMCHFSVTVVDNRGEFASTQRLPHVDQIFHDDYLTGLQKCSIQSSDYAMVVTQGNEWDFQCLDFLIQQDLRYLGVISSKAKKVKFLKRLKESGIDEQKIADVHIPAGLDIGALTPEEIAVSILAEMLALRQKSRIGSVKFQSFDA